jgi:alanyl-tRNA synthetase
LISRRHVARTGDIKDFVIIEESGIAKGIRRIVALTGHEAQEARRIAASLKTRLDQIDQMTGRKRDTALKDYTMVRPCMTVFVVYDCILS